MIEIFINKILNKDNKIYTILLLVIMFSFVIVSVIINIKTKTDGLVINENIMMGKLNKNKIGVYIDGQINKPGYIIIPKGSTLEYAINKANGITKNADIQNIDLNRILKNQEKIIIPIVTEELSEEINMEEKVDRININTATKEELNSLDGIGEKTAENIIKYRQFQKFNSIEEIMEVKGIGKSKFDKIKQNICV